MEVIDARELFFGNVIRITTEQVTMTDEGVYWLLFIREDFFKVWHKLKKQKYARCLGLHYSVYDYFETNGHTLMFPKEDKGALCIQVCIGSLDLETASEIPLKPRK